MVHFPSQAEIDFAEAHSEEQNLTMARRAYFIGEIDAAEFERQVETVMRGGFFKHPEKDESVNG